MNLFITEKYLKENVAGFTLNINADLIRVAVKNAQEERISTILGWNFYEHLLNAYTNSTLTSAETTLVDNFIKPAVAARAGVYAYIDIDVPVTNKGPQRQNADYSVNAPDPQWSSKKNQLQNSAKNRENLLISYLCDNKDLFPQFKTNNEFFKSPDLSKNNQTKFRII